MKLENSQIAIRERSSLELCDLALQVIRVNPWGCLGYTLLGCAGWGVLNHLLLLGWFRGTTATNGLTAYGWGMWLLVTLEAPLATLFLTSYLGRAMFESRPQFSQVVRDALRAAADLAWVYGVARGVAIVLGLMLLAVWSSTDEVSVVWVVLAIMIAGLGMLISVFRPFLSEILILERLSVFPWQGGRMPAGLRSRVLHQPATATSIGQALLLSVIGLFWLLAWYGSLVTLARLWGVLSAPEWARLWLWWPVALWSWAAYGAVVRFLFYMNTRICQEGWELDLKFREVVARRTRGATS